jgi:hypothetical protein
VNRVFYWMIVVALGFAAVRQLAYEARADLSPALLGLFDLAEPADGTKLVGPRSKPRSTGCSTAPRRPSSTWCCRSWAR